MNISFCKVGPIRTNCYLAEGEDVCMLVDPGDDAESLLAMIGDKKVELIVATHFHDDHITAMAEVARATGAKTAASSIDAPLILRSTGLDHIDMLLEDGDEFDVGDMHFQVMITPGHTKGSMCLYCEKDAVLFSGDTLFAGTHGRTDFPGGDYGEMVASLKRLSLLPQETNVLPGHEGFSMMIREYEWIERL
ncbi:MAG: MBL fold metallo-hydrolase [Coriobacteriales bacterium]|nr:MBL fold metallo-hydrolase [Coriobacteriales bacterium]